ncbi:MAG: putative peptidoglycan binding domain [Candidatus Parcubacteria bacterium]|jgi:peptidoglycan hydrolase-like protein with peptidoglycan-binding domain
MKKIFEVKKVKIIFVSVFTFFIYPVLVFAADPTQNFKVFANNFTDNVLTTLGTVLMAAAFMFFFYGVVVFIYGRVTQKGDLKDLEKGREFMLWGLVALFVMVSAWGIVRVAQDLLDIDGGAIDIKPVQFNSLNPGGGNVTDNTPTGDNNPLNPTNPFLASTNKPQGADCVGLAGSASQCATGLFCRDLSGNFVKEGEQGTCKKTLEQELSSWPTIKAPTQSEYINVMFIYLKDRNCIPSNIGTFGTTYDEADIVYVKNFQKANNLTQDGIVGQNTWKALVSGNGKKCQ